MSAPLVSVVLPTRNRMSLLKQAVESVLEQTYENMELVVVDDYSDHKVQEESLHFGIKDPRVRVVRNAKNLGFVRSLNVGIQHARGEYIARIDDDDTWVSKEKTAKQIDFLEKNPEYVLVGGGIIRAGEEGKEISRELVPETDEEIRERMLVTDPIVHVAVMFQKKEWEAVGGYDEQFDYAQDWELWMRLAKRGRCYNFQEYFVQSLFSAQGRSSRHMRHHLWMNMVARKRHRKEFPHFWKGYILGWVSYFFSFIPIRQRVSPWVLTLKSWIIR